MSGTAAKLPWTAIIVIICRFVGGIICASAANGVGKPISGTRSRSVTTCPDETDGRRALRSPPAPPPWREREQRSVQPSSGVR